MNNQTQVENLSAANVKIPKNVWALGFVSLFNDISSEMIYPIIPLFLTATLGAPPVIVGLIEGIAEATSGLIVFLSGWWSDLIHKRKLFVTLGYTISGFSKLLLAFAHSWPIVLIARFLDRFGKGTRTAARDAMIYESIDPHISGRAFGLHRAMDTLGAVLGPLLCIPLLFWFANHYQTIFLISVIPVVIGIIILLVFTKEKPKSPPVKKELAIDVNSLKLSQYPWQLRYFLFISIIFGLGNSSDVFLILKAQTVTQLAATTVAMYVTYNIFYTFGAYPAGILSDKLGSKRIITIGFFVFALVYLGFGLAWQPWMVWLLFAIYGLYLALTVGVSKSYISSLVPTEHSGTIFGMYNMFVGFCALFASIIAGYLWKAVSPSAPFIYGAIMAVLAGLGFLLMPDKPLDTIRNQN